MSDSSLPPDALRHWCLIAWNSFSDVRSHCSELMCELHPGADHSSRTSFQEEECCQLLKRVVNLSQFASVARWTAARFVRDDVQFARHCRLLALSDGRGCDLCIRHCRPSALRDGRGRDPRDCHCGCCCNRLPTPPVVEDGTRRVSFHGRLPFFVNLEVCTSDDISAWCDHLPVCPGRDHAFHA